ncbi:ATP-binding protein [uncultured Cocleimonas sp.]|uniref:ATP-binding protein n=1 Tax=uncultured Cocleimonas sp. TaxID=1051587 RepID=UPI00262319C7|nr:ATP-binding protein [uncultured Cocleimonas sp.]
MNTINQTEIDSDLSEVKNLASHFQAFCTYNKLNEQLSGLLELALVEAVNNIVIHAYEGVPGNSIKADYKKTDDNIIITLTDFGKQFSAKDKNAESKSDDIDALPEGNWGIDLIESIVDEIKRSRTGNSNTLTIIKSIN